MFCSFSVLNLKKTVNRLFNLKSLIVFKSADEGTNGITFINQHSELLHLYLKIFYLLVKCKNTILEAFIK